ncbi:MULTISPECIES: hypothetical protein [Chryseobacterium]|uniref:DUF4402 domain-containing protein n=1 Tax=Chryseobacterium camelliae TaxID=1265445 RepID=A0ABU0TLF5_9FLAO|nr:MULTISPECIES: hypothetical protein [Chryseobacterium]MDT3408259.1 hypothetical protein [Pseudacidovorax intermedius]MDQ1097886.1 hypothetical protein [Chryseobacterium camelliae]MDQ1101820.1 hypothetical protein [Chryseobacterium sp. SORGH_AS_1048]MDR6085258.1 hypothetical protein [Chryseobacterium sp. SORGH_AS_0909]MDR6129617.1 hypothetical protein [Chryseobacterium sp. SORGH_AS_1175]
MKNMIRLLILLLPFFYTECYSQSTGNRTVSVTLPVVTLLDVEPTGNISMSFTAPADAGRPIISPTINTTKWINYTSAIVSGGVSRHVTASVNQTIPGVNIRLQAAAASGTGGGALGTPSAQVTLGTTPITIISGIGGAFTGNGANNGHRISIALVTSNYANLSAITAVPVTITYTISE